MKVLKISCYLVVVTLGSLYILNYLFNKGEANLYVVNNTDMVIEEVQIRLHNQSHTMHNLEPGQQKKFYFTVWREGGYDISVKFLNKPTIKHKAGYLMVHFDTSEVLEIFEDNVVLKDLPKTAL